VFLKPRRTLIVLCFGILFLSACSVRQVHRRLILPDHQTLDREAPYLKVHLKNGDLLVLTEWAIQDGNRITGVGSLYDARRAGGGDAYRSAPLDSVALFETNVTKVSPSVGALTLMSGASLAFTGYCIANPKSCFGSCPTFYVSDGAKPVLMAEGFSASIAPSLEATDTDALVRARPAGGRLEVAMVNEALETHVVRHVDLLAVPRPAGKRVFATPGGGFLAAAAVSIPVSARGPEGDILSAVVADDGVERYSAADSLDLAAREILEFTFAPGSAGPAGLVIGSRQTLLSTFLFYRTLAAMGTQAGTWLATLERQGAGAKERFSGPGGILGGIEIRVDRNGAWERAGEIQEHGPLAVDVVCVPLGPVGTEPVRVQLRMTRGKHRLDVVALARVDQAVEPIRLAPVAVLRVDAESASGVPDPDARDRLTDPGKTLVTFPGDRYTLVYEFPGGDGGGNGGGDAPAWDLFLESRGYYLEWIREAWLPDESASDVAEILFLPRRALRRLAPEFKAVEGEMEDFFWRSKYARP
jgi:hypothetical protein